MKQIISIIFAILAISPLYSEVLLLEAEVKEMIITKWKGTWAAPGGKQIKYLVLHVTKYRAGSPSEGDEKVLAALKENPELRITIERYPISYSMDTSDYKFLKKHKNWFSNKVSPKLAVTGRLLFGKIPSNSDKDDYILLRNPTFTSRKGSYTIPHYGASSPASSRRLKFNEVHKK